jgi:hypothetical protein
MSDESETRVNGEHLRARQSANRLKTILHSTGFAIEDAFPPGIDAAQAVAHAAIDLAMSIAKLDAYRRAHEDAAALRARVAELEAVVRAADAMRDDAVSRGQFLAGLADYDTARAKVEVPRG